MFSPVSVASVLQMALCGARGRTAAELAGALHLDGSPDTAAAARRTLSGLVATVTAGGTVTFRVPAAVWVQADLPLRPDFTARLGEAVAETDFAGVPQQAREQINRVVAEQTEQKITGAAAGPRDRRPDPAGADQRHLPQGKTGAQTFPGARDRGGWGPGSMLDFLSRPGWLMRMRETPSPTFANYGKRTSIGAFGPLEARESCQARPRSGSASICWRRAAAF